jgi:hypothetical protein
MNIRINLAVLVTVGMSSVACMKTDKVDLRTKRQVSTAERIQVIEQQIKNSDTKVDEDAEFLDSLKSDFELAASDDLGESEEQELESDSSQAAHGIMEEPVLPESDGMGEEPSDSSLD